MHPVAARKPSEDIPLPAELRDGTSSSFSHDGQAADGQGSERERPRDRATRRSGSADALIAAIGTEAESKGARHDMKEHRGSSADEALRRSLADLQPAATALATPPADEAEQVGAWLVGSPSR
jgi:hypothetical protein